MLGIKFSKETVEKLELELEIAQKLNNLRLYICKYSANPFRQNQPYEKSTGHWRKNAV